VSVTTYSPSVAPSARKTPSADVVRVLEQCLVCLVDWQRANHLAAQQIGDVLDRVRDGCNRACRQDGGRELIITVDRGGRILVLVAPLLELCDRRHARGYSGVKQQQRLI